MSTESDRNADWAERYRLREIDFQKERREMIATAALAALLRSRVDPMHSEMGVTWGELFAKRAIVFADALIAELDKEESE